MALAGQNKGYGTVEPKNDKSVFHQIIGLVHRDSTPTITLKEKESTESCRRESLMSQQVFYLQQIM